MANINREVSMTFLPFDQLHERRTQGLSPKGGMAPRFTSLSSEDALGMSAPARVAKLDQLLVTLWNHPGDSRVMESIYALCGDNHSVAFILTAADYAYRQETQIYEPGLPKEIGKKEYLALVREV